MSRVPVVNQPLSVPLSKKRQDLMHAVMDGNTELAGVMYILHHYRFCDNFLIWLISHKYTGKNLEELVVKKFSGSIPSLVDYIVGRANGGRLTNEREGS